MSLLTIEEEAKTLSKMEKLQLIADLTRMLQEEESNVRQCFTPGEKIDYHGPVIEPKIAEQLEEYMEKKKKERS